MLENKIYHNPRCSKSRSTLALLKENGIDVPVIAYLETPPTAQELATICEKLNIAPLALIRTKEALFAELGLHKTDVRSNAEWCDIMAQNPKLIERPIVIYNGKVALGRPPENILSLLS